MTDGNDAHHTAVLRNTEQGLHYLFCRTSVSSEPVAHLYPAGAQSEVLCLKQNMSRCNRSIFHPHIADGRVGKYHDSQRCTGQEVGTHLFALTQGCQHLLVLYYNELIAVQAFAARSHQSGKQQ